MGFTIGILVWESEIGDEVTRNKLKRCAEKYNLSIGVNKDMLKKLDLDFDIDHNRIYYFGVYIGIASLSRNDSEEAILKFLYDAGWILKDRGFTKFQMKLISNGEERRCDILF